MKRLIMILVLFASLNLFAEEDMSTYLMNAQKLVQEGKNEEALKRFVWLYNHSLEQDPAFSAVRLSYLLGYWVELGAQYPPALNALQEIRDRETELIKNGKGNSNIFDEVISINKYLLEDERSIALFEFMDKKYPVLAQSSWVFIRAKIIAAKKFDLARKYMPDLMKEFRRAVFSYKRNVLYYETYSASFKEFNESSFIDEVLGLIAVAEASGDKKTANRIRIEAFEILPSPRLKQPLK